MLGLVGRLILVTIAACPVATAVSAQWLAARLMDEQRHQASPETPSSTDRDLDSGRLIAANREARDLVLTWPLLQRYSAVRVAILQAIVQSPDLAQ